MPWYLVKHSDKFTFTFILSDNPLTLDRFVFTINGHKIRYEIQKFLEEFK